MNKYIDHTVHINDISIDPDTRCICSRDTISTGFTPLMWCSGLSGMNPEYNQQIDEYLKNNPGEINKQNNKGWTALMIACRNCGIPNRSSVETVKILLQHNADPNLKEHVCGTTALTMSCRYATSLEVIEMLLDNGANIDHQDDGGYTPLIESAMLSNPKYSDVDGSLRSSEEVVKLLLDRGADPYIREQLSPCKLSALSHAMMKIDSTSTLGTVKIFLEYDIDIMKCNYIDRVYKHICKNKSELSDQVLQMILDNIVEHNELHKVMGNNSYSMPCDFNRLLVEEYRKKYIMDYVSSKTKRVN